MGAVQPNREKVLLLSELPRDARRGSWTWVCRRELMRVWAWVWELLLVPLRREAREPEEV